MAEPFLVVSDVHLSHEGAAATAGALAELVQRHPGREIIFAGDIFGLSSDPPKRDPVESAHSLLRAYPSLTGALHAHLASGAALSFLAGNHDAALSDARARPALLSALDLTPQSRLAIKPWFIRRGRVHVEHGHIWDPDNAPAHPLATWSPSTEPLGISLTRHFVARRKVWQFAHAHETTLLKGLQRAFQLFGAGAPLLVAQYFSTSGAICAATLFDRGLSAEREQGARSLPRVSEEAGVSQQALQTLLEAAPSPTHTEFQRTFLRLYFDRVFAVLLGPAATVPPSVVPILIVLLIANMIQNVASCLLQHTGFFREIARVASFLVLAMAAMTALVYAAGFDIVGFIGAYAAVYVAGAALYIAYVVRKPFRIAAQGQAAAKA